MEEVLLCAVGEAQPEFGRGPEPRVDHAHIFRRARVQRRRIADVDSGRARVVPHAVAVAVADEAVKRGRVPACQAETALAVPHIKAPKSSRAAFTCGHPVVMGPVPHGRIRVAHHIIGDVVGVHVRLRQHVVRDRCEVVGAQEGERVVPVDRVSTGELARLDHVPTRRAAVVLLHEGLAQVLAEVVVALPNTVHVDLDDRTSRVLLAGSDVDPPYQLVSNERVGHVVLAGAQPHVLELRDAAFREEGVVLRRLAQLAPEKEIEGRLLVVRRRAKPRSRCRREAVTRPRVRAAGDAQACLRAQRNTACRIVLEADRALGRPALLHRHIESRHIAEVVPLVADDSSALDGHDAFAIRRPTAEVRPVESQRRAARQAQRGQRPLSRRLGHEVVVGARGGRYFACLEAARAHRRIRVDRERRAVERVRRRRLAAVQRIPHVRRRIGRRQLQQERCRLEAAQVAKVRGRADRRKEVARVRRARRGDVGVRVLRVSCPNVRVEVALRRQRRRDLAHDRARRVDETEVLAVRAELEVRVQVRRPAGGAHVEAGGHDNQVAARHDRAAGREVPLARLAVVVGQRPPRQVHRLGSGVVQLDPVALRVRRVFVEVDVLSPLVARADRLGLAGADEVAPRVCRTRERPRARPRRRQRRAADQVGTREPAVVRLHAEHVVAAREQRVRRAEQNHFTHAIGRMA